MLKLAPVATFFGPAILPVFDESWKTLCNKCAHCRQSEGDEGNVEWRCMASQRAPMSRRPVYCIDGRAKGADCGLGGKLFLHAV